MHHLSLGGRRGRIANVVLLDGVPKLIRIVTIKALERLAVPDEEEGRIPVDVIGLSNFLYVCRLIKGNTA